MQWKNKNTLILTENDLATISNALRLASDACENNANEMVAITEDNLFIGSGCKVTIARAIRETARQYKELGECIDKAEKIKVET